MFTVWSFVSLKFCASYVPLPVTNKQVPPFPPSRCPGAGSACKGNRSFAGGSVCGLPQHRGHREEGRLPVVQPFPLGTRLQDPNEATVPFFLLIHLTAIELQ